VHRLRYAVVTALAVVPLSVAQAQACGPLNFSFSVTGPGCFPNGPGLGIPTLGVGLVPPTVPNTCAVQFSTPLSLIPPLLAIGTSNPALDLTPLGFPGCTLLATPQIVVPMPVVSGFFFTLTALVPQDPALIGASVFAQGFMLFGGTFALTNGREVAIL
jgi:hypothetical protein